MNDDLEDRIEALEQQTRAEKEAAKRPPPVPHTEIMWAARYKRLAERAGIDVEPVRVEMEQRYGADRREFYERYAEALKERYGPVLEQMEEEIKAEAHAASEARRRAPPTQYIEHAEPLPIAPPEQKPEPLPAGLPTVVAQSPRAVQRAIFGPSMLDLERGEIRQAEAAPRKKRSHYPFDDD